ncbi:MAG TPA: hypothetical protein VEL74_24975 [Thermoanaerobaculia bacterium]|nr:hypothetical protein [Thermoanaerobaculia bacterium]
MKKALVLALAMVALGAISASATTVLYVPMNKSVDLSEVILLGHVLRMEPAYNAEGEIVTRIDLLVEEGLKGGVERSAIFSFFARGGSLDGVHVETVGEAKYRLGERVLVQLESIDGEYYTLGLAFGKWNVAQERDGRPVMIRNLSDLHMVGAEETPVDKFPLQRMRDIAALRQAF